MRKVVDSYNYAVFFVVAGGAGNSVGNQLTLLQNF